MKKLLIVFFTLFSISGFGQVKPYKIVFDLASKDTADFSGVLRQFNNILKVAPDAELEVVCHGPAIIMLVKDKTLVEEKMMEVKNRAHVSFKACANSMKRMHIDQADLVSLAEVVPVAMLELADRQMEGWSYIRAGQ
ncbi:MAG: hypothetical protein GC171_01710 [Terrimonas sp.]|nr:hypothetical protein [Terrimonas sp.]